MDKKYRIAKDFTPMDFYDFIKQEQKENCKEFQDDFEYWIENAVTVFYIYRKEKGMHGLLDDMIKDRKYFREYLLKGGFIEEVEEEVFYKVGDVFEYVSFCKVRRVFLLSVTYSVDKGYAQGCLIETSPDTDRTGYAWTRSVNIESPSRITQSEFDEMCGNQAGEITRVS